MGEEKLYDMVVFGASGVTGKYVAEELAKIAQKEKITWAVAGRNEKKLQEVLKNASKYSQMPEEELLKVPIIIADVQDQGSIEKMARVARVVINCVGPYQFYGEQVVAACVKEKASHFDMSGEKQFLEKMLLKYHQKAKENGVYIVGACGLDSIPCDMAVTHLKNNFDGDLNSVETFLSVKMGEGHKMINFGTWQSIIYGAANIMQVKPIRLLINSEIFTKPLPHKEYPLKKRGPLFQDERVGSGWCIPFLGSDKSVSVRTQLHNYNENNERPAQVQCYLMLSSFLVCITIFLMALFILPMCFFSFGRRLLEKYPEFFSLGYFGRHYPTREEVANDSFQLTAYGEGWKEKLAEPSDSHGNTKPDKKAMVKVTGPEPAYVTTSICLVQVSLCVLREKDKMPNGGGVYTPGAAFGKTSLVDRLSQNGLVFEYTNL